MANKNSVRRNLLNRKESKAIGKAVDSSFGAPGNNHRNPRRFKTNQKQG